MTQQENRAQLQSPASIRTEVFSHRMRGLDEDEVREYLEQLADQVEAADAERAALRAEVDRLRSENNRLREQAENAANEISPQAVALFSQAQQVADQLVEEAVVHARDLMQSARNQQRDILQRAHDAAEEVARRAGAYQAPAPETPAPQTPAPQGAATQPGYTTPVPEVEYVRTFARVAQVQLRSVLDALAEQVDRLGQVPQLDRGAALEPGSTGFDPQTYPVPHSRAEQTTPQQPAQATPQRSDRDPLGVGHRSDADDEGDVTSIYQQIWSIQGRAVE